MKTLTFVSVKKPDGILSKFARTFGATHRRGPPKVVPEMIVAGGRFASGRTGGSGAQQFVLASFAQHTFFETI